MSNTDGAIKVKVRVNQVVAGVPVIHWYTGKTGESFEAAFIANAQLVKVYRDGKLLEPEIDYIINDTTIVFTTPLISDDTVAVEAFIGQ